MIRAIAASTVARWWASKNRPLMVAPRSLLARLADRDRDDDDGATGDELLLNSSPMRMRPLLIRPIISDPMIEPTTVPTPPNRLVPPSTAAAITESSSPWPSWKRPDWRRPA